MLVGPWVNQFEEEKTYVDDHRTDYFCLAPGNSVGLGRDS